MAAYILDDARALHRIPTWSTTSTTRAPGFTRPSECRIHIRYTHLDDVRHAAAAWSDPIGSRIGHDDSAI